MKFLKKLFIFSLIFFSFSSLTNAGGNDDSSVFSDKAEKMLYCTGSGCNIKTGLENLGKNLDKKLQTNGTSKEYAEGLVKNLMGYVSIIAVFIIIFSGFQIMTAGGNDDVIKKQKKVIIGIVMGITLMWTARVIVEFIINIIGN